MPRLVAVALVAALFVCLPACGGGGGGDSIGATPPSGGTLKISVTDAPFPSSYVVSASVVINEVRVRNKDLDQWETVYTGAEEIDLVPLTGGIADLLVEVPLAPGTYDEVRLIVDAGEVVLNDQAVVQDGLRTFNTANDNLKFPSGAQTGIKVKIDNDIVVTTQLSGDLVLDFDLSKSFVFNGPVAHAPGVKRVIFTPVVRATNASTAGTVAMDIRSDNATPLDPADDFPLVGATVRLFDDTDTEIAMALTDALGHAEFSVGPGTYSATVEAAAHDLLMVVDPTDDDNLFDVALANLTDLGVQTMVASETEIVGNVFSNAGTVPPTNDDDTVLPGVTVEARAAGDTVVVATTMTDEQGAFVLSMLAPGDYDLTFIKAGWDNAVVTAVTAALPGTAVGQVVRMNALFRDITGTVTDNAAAPINAAAVTIIDANGDVIGSATTAADGTYTIAGVPSGFHKLSVDNAGVIVISDLTVVGTNPVTSQTADVQFP